MTDKIELELEIEGFGREATRNFGYEKEYSPFCEDVKIKYKSSYITKAWSVPSPEFYSLLIDLGKNISEGLLAALIYDAIKTKLQGKEKQISKIKLSGVTLDLTNREASIRLIADKIEMSKKKR